MENFVMHSGAARTDVVFADAGRHEHQHEAGLFTAKYGRQNLAFF